MLLNDKPWHRHAYHRKRGCRRPAPSALWPWAGSGFGPLPLLVVMTVVTGVADAVSYLALGHVFVANRPGNVVFLGFVLPAAGGRPVRRPAVRAAAANSVTAPLLGAAAVLAAMVGLPVSSWQSYALVAAIALAGVQNAMARSLAVPN